MGLFRRIISLFRRRRPSEEGWVRYYDSETKRIVHIPPAELRPGCVEAHLQGEEGLVWVQAGDLQQSEIRHPPFDESVLAYLREIQSAFAEVRPMSIEEWEDGFRRDTHPEREIALWVHAARVYRDFASEERSPEWRDDLYGLIVACLCSGPETVWHVAKLRHLTRDEAEQVVARYSGKAV